MTVVGVAGAGTMGAGIAALAAEHFPTRLYDPDPNALAGTPAEAVSDLSGLAGCDLVIEAAPEDLELKRSVFSQLAAIVAPECVLATNTSSLSVTAIAAQVPGPERVVGMHFFNPPGKMRLLEVVAGDLSTPAAVAAARAAGEAIGKHVIEAADGPGFIVNRCNRPFSLEAMRIVQEGAAPEDVDAACRRAGFRMGPFALMDLVGIDVGFAVAQSFYEQSFGEPRWRPSPLAARLVASGRLGRKTGRGWYEYPPGPPRIEAADELDPIAERIVCQLVNEAYFALGEGVGSAVDIDAGMVLGLNHPRGPFAWGERLGRERVLGVLARLRETGGDAYRPAPLLARGELRH